MPSHPARHTVIGPHHESAAHAARPAIPRARLVALLVAVACVLAAFGLGLWALAGSVGPSTSTPTSARLITVSPSAHG